MLMFNFLLYVRLHLAQDMVQWRVVCECSIVWVLKLSDTLNAKCQSLD
jgi:hypothetical protein